MSAILSPRLFVGVHHDATSVPIILATQAALDGPWVMGPSSPATHALLVVLHNDGRAWRLDGQPGGARWTPCRPFRFPSRLWEVRGSLVPHAIDVARELDGTPYGWDEVALQATRAVALLPWVSRILPAPKDLLVRSMICTRVALHVLDEADAHLPVDSLYPERLAQVAARRLPSALWGPA